MNQGFALDKSNARMMGVCSGFARWAEVDPTLVRVGTILLAFLAGPVALVAYVAAGMVAEAR